jgi:plastocyanin
MLQRVSLLIALLVVGPTSLLLTVPVTGQTIGEENVTSLEGNMIENNTIILNAAEVGEDETAEQGEDETAEQGEDETYRWVDSTGTENPHLNIISNMEYTVKIDNPTDEEHQLIIDSESDGKVSVIAEGPEIKPGKNNEFKFTASQVGELGYHCKYHPDQMNGTITVS